MRTKYFLLLSTIIMCCVIGLSSLSYANIDRKTPQEQIPSYSNIVNKVSTAIVNIRASKINKRGLYSNLIDHDFFHNFFKRSQTKLKDSVGSGVILSEEGHVITSAHVVSNSEKIFIILEDGTEYLANIVLLDVKTDLAILKIEKLEKKLNYIDLQKPSNILRGDIVLAIGNPFGLGQTITSGIISALNRPVVSQNGRIQFYTQTDANINTGNSGGGLVDMTGKLVGINSAIYSNNGQFSGIGFATPISIVSFVWHSYQKYGKINNTWLGVSVSEITDEILGAMQLDDNIGVMVKYVHREFLDDFEIGDRILAINGKAVTSKELWNFYTSYIYPYIPVTITLVRNKEIYNISVKPRYLLDYSQTATEKISEDNLIFGNMIFANLSPYWSSIYDLDYSETGVVLVEIENSLTMSGLQKGDIIHKINDIIIRDVDNLEEVMNNIENKAEIILKRNGQVLFLQISR